MKKILLTATLALLAGAARAQEIGYTTISTGVYSGVNVSSSAATRVDNLIGGATGYILPNRTRIRLSIPLAVGDAVYSRVLVSTYQATEIDNWIGGSQGGILQNRSQLVITISSGSALTTRISCGFDANVSTLTTNSNLGAEYLGGIPPYVIPLSPAQGYYCMSYAASAAQAIDVQQISLSGRINCAFDSNVSTQAASGFLSEEYVSGNTYDIEMPTNMGYWCLNQSVARGQAISVKQLSPFKPGTRGIPGSP